MELAQLISRVSELEQDSESNQVLVKLDAAVNLGFGKERYNGSNEPQQIPHTVL